MVRFPVRIVVMNEKGFGQDGHERDQERDRNIWLDFPPLSHVWKPAENVTMNVTKILTGFPAT